MPSVGKSQIFSIPCSSMTSRRASRSRYSGRIGSGLPRSSSGERPLGLPRKYSIREPAGDTGSKVGLVTARQMRPPMAWYLRPPMSTHWMTRGPSAGFRCRVKASSAS